MIVLLTPSWAEVEFSDLNLGTGDRVLFKASTPSPASGTVSGFFLGNAATRSLESLTFMAERMLYLPKTGQLQIQNRFGIFRSGADLKSMEQVSPTAFVRGQPVPEGKMLPQASSADGRFLIYQNPTSLLKGDLVLYEPAGGQTLTVSTGLPLDYRQVPVLWSPDSQFFLYSRDGGVYYFSVRQMDEKRVPAEAFRLLGSGNLSSASWGEDNSLYLVMDEFIYRILPQQFFTHSLYGGLFRTGSVVGKLPHVFDPDKDQFWMASDRNWILLNLRGRSLFLYPLEIQDFYPTSQPIIFKPLPSSLEVMKVIWGQNGQATILSRSLFQGKELYEVFRLTSSGLQSLLGPQETPLRDLILSPGKEEIALLTETGASIRDALSMKELRFISHPGLLHGAYRAEGQLLLSGRAHTSVYTREQPQGTLLFLSDLEVVGFTAEGTLGAKALGKNYLWKGKGLWVPVETLELLPATGVSPLWRVYSEPQSQGPYGNMIMVRDLKSGGTFNFLPYPEKKYDAFPLGEESTPKDLFTHGSRLRHRHITLSIDAENSAEGLPEVLRILKDYGFRTTFFINGEFLRRQPNGALEISRSGHETASGFSLLFDMSDSRFKMDENFIRSGLARNEDDWYNLTGKELSLFWHAPGYYVDDTVIRGGQQANYTYVSRDVEFPRTRSNEVDILQAVETILRDKKPGSIIPLTLGMKDGTTGVGFFKYLDILVNALVQQGYDIVPISVLKDNLK